MNQPKIKLYNTLGRKKEDFIPINEGNVLMYSCGPTVYDYAHIGNLRAYIFTDILRKTLKYEGYEVKQIMNITDIGHLSSDADTGEDKMTKGLMREGKELTLKGMRELAEFYTERFKEDLKALNIDLPDGLYFASDYVKEDIELIEKLEKKNYTYKTSDGIYFDTLKMEDYGILWGGKKIHDEEEARIVKNPEKKNSEDFALWKFNDKLGFPSPWGTGFPGWHIECSALGIKFLGEQFDIHTGGIEHIGTHHTNEIAQSECATGKKPFVRYWLHNEWVLFGDKKIAKSSGSFLKLADIKTKASPLSYRFLLLMANYGTKINFNMDALEGAEIALKRVERLYLDLGDEMGKIDTNYQEAFKKCLEDDLDTPRAISLLFELLKDEKISNKDKKATILDFDKVLSLGFKNLKEDKISEDIQKILKEREAARKEKNFKKSDELRKKLNSLGYEVNDTRNGQRVYKL